MDIDFDKLVLRRNENSAMRKLSKHKSVILNEYTIDSLSNLGFINREYSSQDDCGDPIYNNNCQITDLGTRYWLYKKAIYKTRRNEWIRYIVTTAIASIALILSIVSLYIQYVQQLK